MPPNPTLIAMAANLVDRNRFLQALRGCGSNASQADLVYKSEWVNGQFYRAAFHLQISGHLGRLLAEEVFKDAILKYRRAVEKAGCHYNAKLGNPEGYFYRVGRTNSLAAARGLARIYFPKREASASDAKEQGNCVEYSKSREFDLKEFLATLPSGLLKIAEALGKFDSQAEVARALSIPPVAVTRAKLKIRSLLLRHLQGLD